MVEITYEEAQIKALEYIKQISIDDELALTEN